MELIKIASWSIDSNGALMYGRPPMLVEPVGIAPKKDISEYPPDFFHAVDFDQEFEPSVNDHYPSLFETLALLHKRQRSGKLRITSDGPPRRTRVKIFNDIQFKVSNVDVGSDALAQSIDIYFMLDGRIVESLSNLRMTRDDGSTREQTLVYALDGSLGVYTDILPAANTLKSTALRALAEKVFIHAQEYHTSRDALIKSAGRLNTALHDAQLAVRAPGAEGPSAFDTIFDPYTNQQFQVQVEECMNRTANAALIDHMDTTMTMLTHGHPPREPADARVRNRARALRRRREREAAARAASGAGGGGGAQHVDLKSQWSW